MVTPLYGSDDNAVIFIAGAGVAETRHALAFKRYPRGERPVVEIGIA